MNCQDCKDRLIDYLYGELPENKKAEMQKHLQDCRDCLREYEELRATRKAFANLPDPEPPAFIETRILAQAREAQTRLKGSLFSRIIFHPASATVALAVIILIVGGHYVGTQFRAYREQEKEMVFNMQTPSPAAKPERAKSPAVGGAAAPAPEAEMPEREMHKREMKDEGIKEDRYFLGQERRAEQPGRGDEVDKLAKVSPETRGGGAGSSGLAPMAEVQNRPAGVAAGVPASAADRESAPAVPNVPAAEPAPAPPLESVGNVSSPEAPAEKAREAVARDAKAPAKAAPPAPAQMEMPKGKKGEIHFQSTQAAKSILETKASPEEIERNYREQQLNMENKNYDAAIRNNSYLVSNLSPDDPRNRIARINLGIGYVRTNRCDQAVPLLERALVGNSDTSQNFLALKNLEECYTKMGRKEDAQRAGKQLSELTSPRNADPETIKRLNALGYIK